MTFPPEYQNITRWQVITGAPCSGKTSVVDELARRGFRVVAETARDYIDSQLALGRTLEEIKSDPLAFERAILLEKVKIERALPGEEIIFMDRAVPDSIAYYELEGLDTGEPLAFSSGARYQTIFLLERLTFQKDRVRSENPRTAARLEALLRETYTTLGYGIIEVPVMDIIQRVDFILNNLMDATPPP